MDRHLSPYASSLDVVAKSRYLEKLDGLGERMYNIPDPYIIPESKWIHKISVWPPVEFGDIYMYLKTSGNPDYNDEKLKNYKSLAAYEYVVSGKVLNVVLFKGQNKKFSLLSAEVQRSQKISLENHKPWVIIADNGTIKAAHCTCMAGLGEACSHVAALLFTIEKGYKLQMNGLTPTDVPCKWQCATSKQVESTTIKNMTLMKARWNDLPRKRKIDCIGIPDLPALEETEIELLRKLCPGAVCLQGFDHSSSTESADDEELPTIQNCVTDAVKKGISVKDHLLSVFDGDVCIKIAQSTVGQSSNTLWYKHRKGRLTSSKFKTIIKRKLWNDDFIKDLIDPKMLKTAAVTWGCRHEGNALKAYTDIMMCQHSNFNVKMSGLLVHESYPFLGASPDAIISCDCCGTGAVEIKCPFKHKNKTISEILQEDKVFCLKSNGEMKENHPYFYQVQGQMAIGKFRFCDFVVWTTVDMMIRRIEYQHEFWKSTKSILETIYFSNVLPVLQSM